MLTATARLVDGPREKLLELGVEALGDSELIAVLLGTGTREQPVSLLAQHLLNRVGGLRGLARVGVRDLSAVTGVGPGKAARIAAALELGRRVSARPLERG